MYSIVYQPRLFAKTIFIYIEPSLKATHTDHIGEIALMYHQQRVIGVNMFNVPSSVTEKLTEGIQRTYHPEVEAYVFTSLREASIALDLGLFHSGFVIGEILEIEVHPESDHLLVCQVQTLSTIQIVTNSSKVKVGDKVVIALPGAITALGLWITEGSILKVESKGMFCSEKTLGLEETNPGVFILGSTATVGKDFYENLRS
jgi:tRNA-binding protein